MAPHAELAACVEPSGKADSENEKKGENPSRIRSDRAVLGPHGETAVMAGVYGIEEAPPDTLKQASSRTRHRNRHLHRNAHLGAGYAEAVPLMALRYNTSAYRRRVPYEAAEPHEERPLRTRRPGSSMWPRPVHWPQCQACNRLTRYRWLACSDCYWLLCLLCYRVWQENQLECPCGTTYLRDMT